MTLGEWLRELPQAVRGGVMQDTATGKWHAVFTTNDGKELCSADRFASRVEAEAYLEQAVEALGLRANRLH